MQSVILPCRAVLPHQEPERVRIRMLIIELIIDFYSKGNMV